MVILYEEPDNGFVGLHFDKDLNIWVMHMDCKDWSLSTYKRYKKIWDNKILPHLKEIGINEFYGLCETHKALKFNMMFGVNPTGHIVTTDDNMEQILTRRII